MENNQNNKLTGNIFKFFKLLKKIKRFETFSEDGLRSFIESGSLLEFFPGDTIVKKGGAEKSVFFLLSGSLSVSKNGKVINTLNKTGDIFGEMSMIDGSKRSATIIADTHSIVLYVDSSLLDKKLKDGDYAFCYTLYRIFAESLADRLRWA